MPYVLRKTLVVAAFAAGAVSFLSPAEAKDPVPCTTVGSCEEGYDTYMLCCMYLVPVDPDCRGKKCEMMLVEECESIPCI